jgi:predicted small lipoprotein YifL
MRGIAMTGLSRLAVVFLTTLLLAGCGQKGQLYLPGNTSAIRTTVPQQQAPGAEEDDEENETPPTLRD